MTDTKKAKDGDKSFFKLFEILEQIGRTRGGLKGREIAELTGIPISTTFRMLKFLMDNGYLRNSGTRYTLGLALARLGNIAAVQNPLIKVSRPLLAELSAKTMETVHLAELKDGQVQYVDKVEGVRSVRMGSLIGSCGPLHCTGVGKAILSALPEERRKELYTKMDFTRYTEHTLCSISELEKDLRLIRERGYAIDNCEHELGVYCLAAPVLDYSGNVIAGISVSGSELYLRDKTPELAELVKQTAAILSSSRLS